MPQISPVLLQHIVSSVLCVALLLLLLLFYVVSFRRALPLRPLSARTNTCVRSALKGEQQMSKKKNKNNTTTNMCEIEKTVVNYFPI